MKDIISYLGNITLSDRPRKKWDYLCKSVKYKVISQAIKPAHIESATLGHMKG